MDVPNMYMWGLMAKVYLKIVQSFPDKCFLGWCHLVKSIHTRSLQTADPSKSPVGRAVVSVCDRWLQRLFKKVRPSRLHDQSQQGAEMHFYPATDPQECSIAPAVTPPSLRVRLCHTRQVVCVSTLQPESQRQSCGAKLDRKAEDYHGVSVSCSNTVSKTVQVFLSS